MTRIRPLALLLVALAAFAPPAGAGWAPGGAPVCVQGAHQVMSAICSDGAGGAYIAWRDGRNSPPVPNPWIQEPDLYVQRLTNSGDPAAGWPVDGIPLCTAPGYQVTVGEIVLAPDGAGGVLAVWSDSRANPGSGDLYAQRVTGTGAVAPGWPVNGFPLCTAPDWQDEAQVVPDGAGGLFSIWRDQRKGSSYDHDTYAQHLTGDGAIAAGWPVDGLALDASNRGTEDCTLLEDGAGGAYFAYTHDSVGTAINYSLILKRLAGSGATAAGWPAAGVVVCRGPGTRIHPRLVHDGAGGVVAVWADTRSDVSGDLYAARVSGAGVLDPAWPLNGRGVAVAPAYQGPPDAVSDGAGGAIAAWSDNRNNAYQIFSQRVTGGGALFPAWIPGGQPVATPPAAQLLGGIASDGMGGAYITYMGGGTIVAQHLTGWGVPEPGWGPDGADLRGLAIGGVTDPRIAATTGGGAIVVWADDRGPAPGPPFFTPNPYDIYAMRVGDSGPVPALASLVGAELRGLSATIVWQLSGTTASRAPVERRVDGGGWSTVGEAGADGSGRFTFVDATLAPAHTYGFRMALEQGGAPYYAPEAEVVVPAASLAIGRVVAAAGPGALELSITLASDETASLELFDVGGRRVASRDVSGLGAGVHAVRMETPSRASGLLLARLRQGGRSVAARAIVVR